MVGGHAIVTFLADPEATDFSVWLCSSCWRCQEACPEGIDIHRLMMEARRREAPPVWYGTSFERILVTGLALGLTQEHLDRLRADRDLDAVTLPPSGLARRLLDPEV
jgi:heterodisulfide reductase subunit C